MSITIIPGGQNMVRGDAIPTGPVRNENIDTNPSNEINETKISSEVILNIGSEDISQVSLSISDITNIGQPGLSLLDPTSVNTGNINGSENLSKKRGRPAVVTSKKSNAESQPTIENSNTWSAIE